MSLRGARRADVFISYVRDDEDSARSMRDHLRAKQLEAFIDSAQIDAGDEVDRIIREKLDEACIVVVICTRASLKSPEVAFEWAYALGQGKPVVPIKYGAGLDLPRVLQRHLALDFTNPRHRDWKGLIARIVEAREDAGVTPALARHLGIEHIYSKRDELSRRSHLTELLKRALPGTRFLVVGRSLESWAREFQAIRNFVETRSLDVAVALVDPDLPTESWMIPGDYAKADVPGALAKFEMIAPLRKGAGRFRLYRLPNSPVFSLISWTDEHGQAGVLELGASLQFDDRIAFVLRVDEHEGEDQFLLILLKVYEAMLEHRDPWMDLVSSEHPEQVSSGNGLKASLP
jgi:hypothetical protein